MKTAGAGGEGDGRDRQPGQGQEDNVVRLPRDWLGPRDELVPFGPSAVPDPPEVESEAGAPPGAHDDPVPVSPADFWGEHAAALHDALEERDGGVAKRVASRAWAMLPFARRRRPAIAAGFALALALIVVGYVSLIGGTGNRARSQVASRLNPSQRGVTSPWSSLRRPSPSHSLRPSRRSGHQARRGPGTRAVAVNYSAYRSTGTSSQGASPPSTRVASVASTGIPVSSPSSTSATASAGARPKSPTPAFGAHGALGPGSSPTH
jgi:hypothetical protein